MNAEEKSRYFEEAARSLQRGGFVAEAVDGEGLLPVQWQGQPLCKVTAEGSVRYTPGEIKRDAENEAICRVADISKITSEYMTLMEAAPPLKAKGLEGGYKLLAEFNGTVLAGHPTQQGVQFVAWERDFDKTGLCWGHYFGEDYGKAKLDFSTRSGLAAEDRLFSAEQLTEVYRAIQETLDSGYPIPEERERLLKGAAAQIERAVPDLQERVISYQGPLFLLSAQSGAVHQGEVHHAPPYLKFREPLIKSKCADRRADFLPVKAKNRRNTLCISRFFNADRRKICR